MSDPNMLTALEAKLYGIVLHAGIITGALVLLALLMMLGWWCVEYSLKRARLMATVFQFMIDRELRRKRRAP